MKFHKTFKQDRTSYVYEFADGKEVTLIPGKDGVTEFFIEELHKLDDAEVENNLKAHKPARSAREEQSIKDWKTEYISEFKAKYGYVPCKTDVDYVVQERFPKNWSLSLDELIEELFDKCAVLSDEQFNDDKNTKNAIKERLYFLFGNYSQRDIEIFKLFFIEKKKKYQIGKIYNLSDSMVCRIIKTIRKTITSDEFLKKFIAAGSDLNKTHRLGIQGGDHESQTSN